MFTNKHSTLILALACLLFCSQAISHEVEKGSKANKMIIEFGNRRSAEAMQAVHVSLMDAPPWVVNFFPASYFIGDIESGEVRTVFFTFDVSREVGSRSSGNVRLKISAEGEKEWNEEIYLAIGDRVEKSPLAPLTVCCVDEAPPTYVQLVDFSAEVFSGQIVIGWTTANEIDNAGFNLYRALSLDAARALINNGLIPSIGKPFERTDYSFADAEVTSGVTYYYWLESVSLNGKAQIAGPIRAVGGSAERPDKPVIPTSYRLFQNYPNPFNPLTNIRFDLPAESRVTLEIFDVSGQKVFTLLNEVLPPGSKTVSWDGKNSKGVDVSGGIYFCKFQAGSYRDMKKIVLLR